MPRSRTTPSISAAPGSRLPRVFDPVLASPATTGLFLDFDGTLSDFVDDPAAARPHDGAVDDLVALHVDVLTTDEREGRRGWALTTPLRTLVDAAASELSQEHVDRAVADALRLGLTTRRRLLRASADAPDRAALRLERALARVAADE